jgi:hypothetical protein
MKRERILSAVLMGLLTVNLAHAGDSLAQQFAEPPAAARPWVYAFIVDGNLSKAGITADLEAMKRAGIGGPWNTPENNCQRVVSTAMQVTGPKQLDAPVQRPFMNLDYYRDIALLAFPTPKGDEDGKTAIDAHFAGFLQKLIDDRSAAAIRLARPGAINDN